MSTDTPSDLPAFVVDGDWHDDAYARLAARSIVNLTGADFMKVLQGPRRHPYEAGQFTQKAVDGKLVYYLNE
jgi:hypothetical protein